MILTIDTEEEPPERLRQIAAFLERLAGGSAGSSYAQRPSSEPEEDEPGRMDLSEDMLSMFDEEEPSGASVDDDDDDVEVVAY